MKLHQIIYHTTAGESDTIYTLMESHNYAQHDAKWTGEKIALKDTEPNPVRRGNEIASR